MADVYELDECERFVLSSAVHVILIVRFYVQGTFTSHYYIISCVCIPRNSEIISISYHHLQRVSP